MTKWKEKRNSVGNKLLVGTLAAVCLAGLGKILSIEDRVNTEPTLIADTTIVKQDTIKIIKPIYKPKDEFTVLAENLGLPKNELKKLHKYFSAYNKYIKQHTE